MESSKIESLLIRIADSLDRMAPSHSPEISIDEAEGFLWQANANYLEPINEINRVDLSLLKGIDHVRDLLFENTQRFAEGLPANNVLLWGARGMGKSSLIKSVHSAINREYASNLALVEIHREEISSLPILLGRLRTVDRKVIVFCDDLSFESNDSAYKSLKAVLEGGIEGRPNHVIFYATSNRRHLMARKMVENEQSTAIHPDEAVEESVSLSDRFGLWLGFHSCNQETYFNIVNGYADYYRIPVSESELRREAIAWSATRGSRSGRVAWQFIQDLAGRKGIKI